MRPSFVPVFHLIFSCRCVWSPEIDGCIEKDVERVGYLGRSKSLTSWSSAYRLWPNGQRHELVHSPRLPDERLFLVPVLTLLTVWLQSRQKTLASPRFMKFPTQIRDHKSVRLHAHLTVQPRKNYKWKEHCNWRSRCNLSNPYRKNTLGQSHQKDRSERMKNVSPTLHRHTTKLGCCRKLSPQFRPMHWTGEYL